MDLAALTIPESVLDGARFVTAAASDVVISEDRLDAVAGKIEARLAAGIDDVDVAFGSAGTVERDVNLILFETACNFCFWSERPDDAWKVARPSGTRRWAAGTGWPRASTAVPAAAFRCGMRPGWLGSPSSEPTNCLPVSAHRYP